MNANHPSMNGAAQRPAPEPRPSKIAIIGDVHDLWEPADAAALQVLGIDLALFVGDFGNEAVPIVRAVANLTCPIAVALGNHDAWYTATPWGQKQCPYDRQQQDWVQDQLDVLGPAHVGYGYRHFPDLDLAVVGGRPFSWGGPEWKYNEFYQQRFGVRNLQESAAKIIAAGIATTAQTLIVLSHNGPHGLGDRPEDPCGRDWQPLGGDYGDPDLQEAIGVLKAAGKSIPLVTFGHMHHRLRHTQKIQRTAVKCLDGSVYFNGAIVPRISHSQGRTLRSFTIVTLLAGQVTEIAVFWLDPLFNAVSEQLLYTSDLEKPTHENSVSTPGGSVGGSVKKLGLL